jgi:hypothetical protein
MKRVLLIAVAGFFLVACASQPAAVAPNAPGLLLGLVHGFFAVPSLVASLFMEVRVYAFPNAGFWYDLGFVTGFCSSMLAIVVGVMIGMERLIMA